MATFNVFNPILIQEIVSDADLIYEYSLMSPSSMIRCCRLLLYNRIVIKAPTMIIDLLQFMYNENYGWISALKEDLRWLSLSGKLPQPCDDLPVIEEFIVQTGAFARIVRKFSASKFANLDIPSVIPKYAEPNRVAERCTVCHKLFSSLQQMCVHRNRLHG